MSNMTPEELCPKPTDSEQPSDSFLEMANDADLTVGQTKRVLAWHKQENQERDQQRLSAALEARINEAGIAENFAELSREADSPIDWLLGELRARQVLLNQKLTAALGPDNSKTKEN